MLRDLFENYRKLENWGVSLFLGALGLVAKQLIEWDAATDMSKCVALAPEAVALPAVMGLIAFLFLRSVNFRAHKVVEKLYTLTGAGRRTSPSLGVVGILLAVMPVALGFFVSWYLATGHADRQFILRWICVGVVVVVAVLVVHVIMRFRESSSPGPNANPPIQPA